MYEEAPGFRLGLRVILLYATASHLVEEKAVVAIVIFVDVLGQSSPCELT